MFNNVLIKAALEPSKVSGKIIEIRDSPSESRILIVIENSRGTYDCLMNLENFITQTLPDLGLESHIKFKIQAENFTFNQKEKESILNSNIQVTASIVPPHNSVVSRRMLVSKMVVDVPNDPFEGQVQDERFQKPLPEEWPSPDNHLPFIPIPIPPLPIPFTRIGYAVFTNSINYVTQQRTTHIDQIPAMRMAGTLKKGTGQAYESYSITYLAQGPAEIISSVQEVFEQISIMPFTSVEGGPFGLKNSDIADIKHRAIAVRNFSLSTVDGLPNALQVEITFDPFNWQYYCSMSDKEDENPANKGISSFDDMLCWPLIKVWAKRAARSTYNGNEFNGRLGLYFPTNEGANLVRSIFSERAVSDPGEDLATLSSLDGHLGRTDGGGGVYSRNFKEIIIPDNTGTKIYFLKVNSRALYDSLINQNEHFVGLVDWSLYSSSSTDHTGKFIPSSASITPEFQTLVHDQSIDRPIDNSTKEAVLSNFVQIPRDSSGTKALAERITEYITAQGGNDVASKVADAREQPQRYFAVALHTTPRSLETLRRDIKKVISAAEREDNPEDYSLYSRSDEIREAFVKNKGFFSDVTDQLSELGLVTLLSDLAIEAGPGGADEDILVERIGGARAHNLALTSQRGDPLPLHQYMGGMDATFIIQGKCFGLEAKTKLEILKETFDKNAIYKKSSKFNIDINQATKSAGANTSFLYVDNEIFSLLGVDFIMPVTLQFESVDQQPGVWNFTLSCIEYNPAIAKAEEVKFLATSWQKLGKIYNYGWEGDPNYQDPIRDKAREFFELQDALSTEEVYPDMFLPTKGELDFWIHCIHKGAVNYATEKGYARHPKPPVKLKPAEAQIVSIVEKQFFPSYSHYIANYWKKSPHDGISSYDILAPRMGFESQSYAEPDFYVWYHPVETFGNIFDGLSEHLMGVGPQKNSNGSNRKRVVNADQYDVKANLFKAEGRDETDPNVLPTGYYREYDPTYGLTNQYGPNYFSGNAEKFSIQQQHDLIWDYHLYPPERAKKAKEELAKAEKTVNEHEGAWWTYLENKYNAAKYAEDGSRPFVYPQVFKDQGYNLLFDRSTALDAFLNPSQEGQASPYNLLANDSGVYFTVDWRQQMVRKFGSRSKLQKLSRTMWDRMQKNVNFFYPQEDLSAVFLTAESGTVDILRELDTPSRAKIEQEIEEKISIIESGKIEKETRYGEIFVNGNNGVPFTWINRTAIINNNFRRWKGATPSFGGTTLPAIGSKGIEGLFESWDYIDGLGAKYNIDPHVIRAVFMRRDGFGKYTKSLSVEDGFGDFIGSKDPAKALENFAQTYAKYARDLHHIPSLVLLCVNLELTSSGTNYRDSNNTINKDLYEKIRAGANTVNKNRFSEFACLEIASVLNSLAPEVGKIIDEYYGAYLTIARNYGSYVIDSRYTDSFFNGEHFAIVTDTKTNNEVSIVPLTPTNNPNGFPVPMNRGDGSLAEANPFVKAYENYDPNNTSIDFDAALATKMQSSLDPHSETALYGSLVDFRTHAPIGKLRGAFPSFQVLLINEGFYWNSGSKKLWDQFYTRTAIANIEVHRSRSKPGSTASVTFSNMFHSITAYALMEALAHKAAVANHELIGKTIKGLNFSKMVGELLNMMLVKNVPEDVRKIWQNNQLKRLALGVGTRIQIRMGYGSQAAKLPIVFTGGVVDAPVSEGYVTLTAVSDGHELDKPTTTRLVNAGPSYAFQDDGAFGMGADPSIIVKHALIAASNWDNITGGKFRDHSQGVSHFGEVIFTGISRYSSEVEFNLYAARRTKIEQGISEIQNYNLVNGLVNWDNERNLFSVSVQEPTPWRIMEVCRKACSDFVASPEPFALRSTVFFGKWWWPYHFTYNPSILTANLKFVGASIYKPNNNHLTKSTDGTKTPAVKEKKTFVSNIINIVPGPEPGAKFAYFTWVFQFSDGHCTQLNYHSNPYKVVYRQDLTLEQAKMLGTDEVIKNPQDYTPTELETNLKGKEFLLDESTLLGRFILNELKTGKVQPSGLEAGQIGVGGFTYEAATYEGDTSYSQIGLVTDYLKDVTNLQLHLKWKPYMQAYIAHSGVNLLDNNIRADSTRVVTDAIGMHQYNGWLASPSVSKTIAFSVDQDIHPSDRKTMMVDTGILLTGLQSGTDSFAAGLASLPGKIPFLGQFIGAVTDPINKYIEESPTTPAIENSVIASLIDQVKEMYQGWFTISGIPTVKPRDLFYFTDHITDLKGPVFVKDVIHKMDAQTGFVTMVSPDAVVLPHDSVIGQQMILGMSVGILHRIGGFLIAKGVAVGIAQQIKNKLLFKANDGKLSAAFQKYQKLKDYAEDVRKSARHATSKLTNDINDLNIELTRLRKDILDGGLSNTEFPFNKSINNINMTFNSIEDIDKVLLDTKLALADLSKTDFNDYTKLAKWAKNYGTTIDIEEALTANKLLDDMEDFEIKLASKAKNLRESLANGVHGFTPQSLENAIQTMLNDLRSRFLLSKEDEINVLTKFKSEPSEAVTKALGGLIDAEDELRALDKIPLSARDSSYSQKVEAAKSKLQENKKEVQKLIDKYEIFENDIPDAKLRKMFNYKPLVFVDGFRKGAIKAGVDAVLATPRTIAEGSAALFDGIIKAATDNSGDKAARAEAKAKLAKLLGGADDVKGVKAWIGSKSWLMPTPVINMVLKLHEQENVIKGYLDEYGNSLGDPDADFIGPLESQEMSAARKVEKIDKVERKLRALGRARVLKDVQKSLEGTIDGIRLLKYANPSAIIWLIVDAVVAIVGGSFIEGHNARLRARQCVKIIPLRSGTIPYTAGIKGHQGAVIGDSPSWVDELISGLHGAGNAFPPEMLTVLGFMAAMGGVELPEWGVSETDSLFLQEQRKADLESMGAKP